MKKAGDIEAPVPHVRSISTRIIVFPRTFEVPGKADSSYTSRWGNTAEVVGRGGLLGCQEQALYANRGGLKAPFYFAGGVTLFGELPAEFPIRHGRSS